MDAIITKLIPIFILAFVGFAAGKLRLLPDNASSALCTFLFFFCNPAVSFSNILSSKIEDVFNLRFLLTISVVEITALGLLALFYAKVFKLKKSALLIHDLCSFYGNISYTGIPVFLVLFDNMIPNIITLIFHSLVILPAMIFLLDWFSGKDARLDPLRTLFGALKNPNFFMPIIAACLLFLNIRLPQVIVDSVDLLGKPTTTVGMFALGLTCSRHSGGKYSVKLLLHALLSSLIKLVCCPALAYAVGRFIFHLDAWWLEAAVVMNMLPTALNVFILGQRYQSEENYASITVLMSTFLFSITISLYLLFIRV